MITILIEYFVGKKCRFSNSNASNPNDVSSGWVGPNGPTPLMECIPRPTIGSLPNTICTLINNYGHNPPFTRSKACRARTGDNTLASQAPAEDNTPDSLTPTNHCTKQFFPISIPILTVHTNIVSSGATPASGSLSRSSDPPKSDRSQVCGVYQQPHDWVHYPSPTVIPTYHPQILLGVHNWMD